MPPITETECIANRQTSFVIYTDMQFHPHPNPLCPSQPLLDLPLDLGKYCGRFDDASYPSDWMYSEQTNRQTNKHSSFYMGNNNSTVYMTHFTWLLPNRISIWYSCRAWSITSLADKRSSLPRFRRIMKNSPENGPNWECVCLFKDINSISKWIIDIYIVYLWKEHEKPVAQPGWGWHMANCPFHFEVCPLKFL